MLFMLSGHVYDQACYFQSAYSIFWSYIMQILMLTLPIVSTGALLIGRKLFINSSEKHSFTSFHSTGWIYVTRISLAENTHQSSVLLMFSQRNFCKTDQANNKLFQGKEICVKQAKLHVMHKIKAI